MLGIKSEHKPITGEYAKKLDEIIDNSGVVTAKFKKGDAVCYKSHPDICIGYISDNFACGLNDELCYNVFLTDEWVKHFSVNGACPNTLAISESKIMLYRATVSEETVEKINEFIDNGNKMTKEEYQIKIAELRKERNYHDKEARRLQEEMDALQIDEKFNDVLVGEYMVFDRVSKGGYKTYFHTDSWNKQSRGIALQGGGFYSYSSGIRLVSHESINYECDNNPTIITKEEYEKAFEDAIFELRREFKGE